MSEAPNSSTISEDNSCTVIIGFHGMFNKPEPVGLGLDWLKAIDEGLRHSCGIEGADLDFELSYWADVIYKHPLHRDEEYQYDDLYNNQPYVLGGDAIQPYDEGLGDRLRAGASSIAGDAVDAIRAFVESDNVSDRALSRSHGVVVLYFDDECTVGDDGPTVCAAMQAPLRSVLGDHADDEIILIAHSFGSIVAYEVLRDLSEVSVAHFITIGSPLGLPVVVDKLKARQRPEGGVTLQTPAAVTRTWLNFADPRDRVALDMYLSNDYEPNDRGVSVSDIAVHNDYVAPGSSDRDAPDANPHKSYGYLRTPEFSEALAGLLGLECEKRYP